MNASSNFLSSLAILEVISSLKTIRLKSDFPPWAVSDFSMLYPDRIALYKILLRFQSLHFETMDKRFEIQ